MASHELTSEHSGRIDVNERKPGRESLPHFRRVYVGRLRQLVPFVCSATLAAMCLTPVQAARLDVAQATEAPVEGYDAILRLPSTGADQKLLLDWGATGGIVVRFTATATEAVLAEGIGQRILGSGKTAAAGEVRVRRRLPLLEVSQHGEVLLRTWCRRPLAGQVGPDAAAKLSDFEIVEAQEPDFNYEFSDVEGTGTSWNPLQGNWKVGVYRDPLIQRDHGDTGPIGASWYEVSRPAGALSLCGFDGWDRYRARCAVEAGLGLRSGLVFYFLDARNFGAFTVRATSSTEGLAELSVVRDGKPLLLQQKTVAWRTGAWHELAVDALDEYVWAEVDGAALPATRLPFFTCGRVGLYADGGDVARFDDVTVTPLRRSVDSFDREKATEPRELGDGWQTTGGTWSLENGGVRGKCTDMARCERVGAGWGGTAVSVTVNPRSGSGGVYLQRTDSAGYALTVGGGRYVLGLLRGSTVEPLKTEELSSTGPMPLSLSWESGSLRAAIGGRRVVLHDFTAPSGSCGLVVEGEADFSGFRADEVRDPTVVISSVSGRPEWVSSEVGEPVPLLGYTWQPRNGRWNPPGVRLERPADWLGGYWGLEGRHATAAGANPPLVPVGYGRPAELWYAHECPGDAVLRATQCKLPDNSGVGLILAAQQGSAASGYTAELTTSDPPMLRIFRQSQVVAEKPVARADSYDLALWRDGQAVLARCGDTAVAYEDPAPLTGAYCLAYARGNPTIGELALGHRRGYAYPFKRVETDWQPEQGEWLTHSGMACIAWNYWLTGRGNPRAFAYHIRPQPVDLHVDFSVSEYTEGYEDGEHRHFPYHDVSLITCAQSKDPDSGYRFLVGKDGSVTQLLRLGQVVAQTADSRFRIAAQGGGNRLRAVHIVADQQHGVLRLMINGASALQYRDPQPLPGGLIGIGVEGCTANFRDLWIAHLEDHK